MNHQQHHERLMKRKFNYQKNLTKLIRIHHKPRACRPRWCFLNDSRFTMRKNILLQSRHIFYRLNTFTNFILEFVGWNECLVKNRVGMFGHSTLTESNVSGACHRRQCYEETNLWLILPSRLRTQGMECCYTGQGIEVCANWCMYETLVRSHEFMC